MLTTDFSDPCEGEQKKDTKQRKMRRKNALVLKDGTLGLDPKEKLTF